MILFSEDTLLSQIQNKTKQKQKKTKQKRGKKKKAQYGSTKTRKHGSLIPGDYRINKCTRIAGVMLNTLKAFIISPYEKNFMELMKYRNLQENNQLMIPCVMRHGVSDTVKRG
jgi:cell division protein YceG involved in septum cleavage